MRAGYGIWLYQFLIIAYLFTFYSSYVRNGKQQFPTSTIITTCTESQEQFDFRSCWQCSECHYRAKFFFIPNDASKLENVVQGNSTRLRLLTFNCKNLVTSKLALQEFDDKVSADILLLQEHWLFDCYLYRLYSEISDKYIGAGKAVDTYTYTVKSQTNISGRARLSIRMIPFDLFKCHVDLEESLYYGRKTFGESNYAGLQSYPMYWTDCSLIISVYIPYKGLTDNVEDFRDCVDQLYEIVSKYKSTRGIFIGGDINEELSVITPGRRGQYFLDFVKKNDF